jgi:DNA primase
MTRFSEQFIHQVQQATDIVDLVSQYVTLKHSGKEFKGLCPFHDDHSPSMSVSPAKQIFYCFVCQAGGSVFQFVHLYDKLSFPEAVKALAQRAGIPIPQDTDAPTGPEDLSKAELTKLTAFAAKFFRGQLDSPAGRGAMDYATKRGLTPASIDRFSLGFAPDTWDALLTAATRARFSQRQLLAAGLVAQKDGSDRCYDRFRNRLMFPIYDVSGQITAFGGRALAADERAKYLNSPETTIFDKSSTLYGLNWSRQGISTSGQAVVVEGYMDAVMPLQAGLDNVVATLGTALTDRHVRLLSRYAKEVVLIFDADAAGQMASERALEIFLAQRLHVRVATIPAGKDPCDYVLSHGPDAMKQLIAAAPDALEFFWRRRQEQLQAAGANLADRRRIIEEFLTMVATSSTYGAIDEIRRGQLSQHIAHVLNLPTAELQQQMHRLSRRLDRPPTATARTDAPSGAGAAPLAPTAAFDPQAGGEVRAQRQLLEVLLNRPDLFDTAAQEVAPGDFTDPQMGHIAHCLWASASAGRGALDDLLAMEQLAAHASLLAQLALAGQERGKKGSYEDTLSGAVAVLVSHRTRRENPPKEVATLDDEALRARVRRGPDSRNYPRIK